MRCLIVGGGGREHALAWKLAQSPTVKRVFVAPGNGGTARMDGVLNMPVSDSDLPGLMTLVEQERISMVVAGPELPLTLGIADACAERGVPCFGPSQAAAQLEGSKIFAKEAMVAAGAPTAAFEVFDDLDAAKAHIQARPAPMVVKADGLAAGKGVIVATTKEEALEAATAMLQDKAFGDAGNRILIEDALVGEEASLLAFCDGENVVALPACQDHKPIGDGDTGPNTGGMGAYSPAPILPDADLQAMCDATITPIVRLMAQRGTPFKGVLYAGLMLVEGTPYLLEYNVRFGDPECQPLMLRLDCDLAQVLLACCEGRLTPDMLRIKDESALCLVLASAGYPGSYEKGKMITGLDAADAVPGVTVFHAGTVQVDDTVYTAGGRVLGVTALGADLKEAKDRAYAAAKLIEFDGKTQRSDIGLKGLKRLGLNDASTQRSETMPLVAIFMGSASDESKMRPCANVLASLGIDHVFTVTSAHRTPARTEQLMDDLEANGCQVFICGAGMAAHLAGAVAARTTKPVIGVPLDASPLGGMDALLATVQMPPGFPVATVALDGPGAKNAGWLAAQILALQDAELAQKIADARAKMRDDVATAAASLQQS